MKIAIMQPYFFPYIGYFQLINSVDKFIIYNDVSFIKQGWINSNNILVGGQSHRFSIPLKNASSFKLINETEINEKLYPRWKESFFKMIELNYKKAPYFTAVLPLIVSVMDSLKTKISDIAELSITTVCNYLQITTKIQITSSIYENSHLKGINRVLDICRIENAVEYINAFGGQKLYNKAEFKENGINLFFIKSFNSEYAQFNMEFVPYLSIIDVMMFNEPSKIKTMLSDYELL